MNVSPFGGPILYTFKIFKCTPYKHLRLTNLTRTIPLIQAKNLWKLRDAVDFMAFPHLSDSPAAVLITTPSRLWYSKGGSQASTIGYSSVGMACSKIFILRIEGDTRTPAFLSICPYISCVSDVSGGPLLFRTSLLTWLFPLPGAPWDPWANKHPQTSDIGCEFKEGHALILNKYIILIHIIYYITYCMLTRFN